MRSIFASVLALSATASNAQVSNTDIDSAFAQCILNTLASASAETTVGEITEQCETIEDVEVEEIDVALERRLVSEKMSEQNPFVITPHKPNYILPAAYNFTPNADPFPITEDQLDHLEMKFQVSLKAPIITGMFNHRMDLHAAYTNTSWWQAYNGDLSAPFRETNHEPELFLSYYPKTHWFGADSTLINFGFAHQSNGQSGTQSRSWNRIYGRYIYGKGPWVLSATAWHRIEEAPKDPTLSYDPNGDDNPDLLDYIGHGQLSVGYKLGTHDLSASFRNSFSSNGSVQLDWTFPLGERIRGNVQYFEGYAESLIDYNAYTQRLGLGFALTDWF